MITAIRNDISHELWSINLDGTDLRQLTDNPGTSLSPDGNWVAFDSGRGRR